MTMDAGKFREIYDESRNGANHFVRHPLIRNFIYSDGVQELAQCGCYWLLDLMGEFQAPLTRSGYDRGLIEVEVRSDDTATVALTVADDQPPVWRHNLDYTDLPHGNWVFEFVDEGGTFVMLLLSER